MLESRYRGAATLDYKNADFAELKYIKIGYSNANGDPQEVITEINFLSDNFISLSVKKKSEEAFDENEDEDKAKREAEKAEEKSSEARDGYLKKLAEIKEAKEQAENTGDFSIYYKKLDELKNLSGEPDKSLKTKQQPQQQEEHTENKEENKKDKRFEVEYPQIILLKFVIGELLYTAKAELKSIEENSTKIIFNIEAPKTLALEQYRKYYRIDLARLCVLVATNKNNSSSVYIARSINLSAGGVLINKLETLTSDKFVTINPEDYIKYNMIIILESDKVLKLSARYVRQEHGKKCYRYAFEFIDIEDEKVDYISKYVIKKQIEQLSTEFKTKNTQALKRR